MWSTARYRPYSVNYWPSFLDVLTATLMVFVLSTYLQVALKVDEPEGDAEAIRVRRQQDEFVARLELEFAPDLTAKNLEVERSLAAIHLRFNEVVLFPRGDYKLNAAGKELLGRLGTFLASAYQPGVHRIQVEGHTDDTPFPLYKEKTYPANNWQLSSARATEVTLYLLEQRSGLPADLFSSTGYAYYRPIADNALEAGKARNRRVEVELLFAAERH